MSECLRLGAMPTMVGILKIGSRVYILTEDGREFWDGWQRPSLCSSSFSNLVLFASKPGFLANSTNVLNRNSCLTGVSPTHCFQVSPIGKPNMGIQAWEYLWLIVCKVTEQHYHLVVEVWRAPFCRLTSCISNVVIYDLSKWHTIILEWFVLFNVLLSSLIWAFVFELFALYLSIDTSSCIQWIPVEHLGTNFHPHR